MASSLHRITLPGHVRARVTPSAAEAKRADPDLSLALGLLLVGAASLMMTTRSHPHALAMEAGMDGCLVVGPVALLVALLGGVRWRKALPVLAPVFVLQVAACFRYRVPVPAVMGMEAVIVGALGALSESIRRQRAAGITADAPEGN